MGAAAGSRIGEVLPHEAWDILQNDPAARLIDVRSRAEWSFVGVPVLPGAPDPIFVEWATFPGMTPNAAFALEVVEALDGAVPSKLCFLCRSGTRSMRAAHAVAEIFDREGKPVECLNVAEGFEGDLDEDRKRGGLNGWKARGLAWQQS